MAEGLSSPSSSDRGGELAAQCELLQAAAAFAWGRVLEAYKSALVPSATFVDPEAVLVNYRNARALQIAAEQALLNYLQSGRHDSASALDP